MKKAPNYNKFLKSVNKLLETKNTKKKIKTVKKNTKKHEVAINIERRRKREQEKLAEVQMRKRNFEHWRIIESSEKYQSLIVQNLCDRKSQIIELEVLDGIFLNLSKKYRAKSLRMQEKVVRGIVKKRICQTIHKCIGRTTDRKNKHLSAKYVTKCMQHIHYMMFRS